MVAGTGRLDTDVMRGADLVAKSGAEGVCAAGGPDGWALALKVSDGTTRAVSPAALAALARQGVQMPQTSGSRPVHDLHGAPVGSIGPLL